MKLSEQMKRKIKAQRRFNSEEQRVKAWMFPVCADTKPFPDDCKDVTPTKKGPCCDTCPYFDKNAYEKLVRKSEEKTAVQ